MTRDPRFDILFEPVDIGPVTTPNRFYQVPHCTGMGYRRPQSVAALRGVKAEGGWGTVCTEYCSIHPSSDDLPHPFTSLWSQADIKAHALMTEKVHEFGSLVRGVGGDERVQFRGCRHPAGKVQHGASEKMCIVDRCRRRNTNRFQL